MINKRKFAELMALAVKAGSVIIMAPATWEVTGQAFASVGALRPLVQLAGVVLVEGVLLTSWFQLEDDGRLDLAERTRHVVTVIAMYLGTLVIALQHGEGAAGFILRLAFGLAIGGTVFETVTGWFSKLARSSDQGRDHQVRRFERRMNRAEAKFRRKMEHEVNLAAFKAERDVNLRRIKNEQERGIKEANLEHQAELTAVQGRFTRQVTAREPVGHNSQNSRNMTLKNGGTGQPIDPARDQRMNEVEAKKRRDYDILAAALRADPETPYSQLAAMIGMSESTVKRRLEDMKELGLLSVNGHREVVG